MTGKRKSSGDGNEVADICWTHFQADGSVFESIRADVLTEDNAFNLDKLNKFAHYKRRSTTEGTSPKKQRTPDPKTEGLRLTSPMIYGASPGKAHQPGLPCSSVDSVSLPGNR